MGISGTIVRASTWNYVRIRPVDHISDALPNDPRVVVGQRLSGYSENGIISLSLTGPTLQVQVACDNTLAAPASGMDLAVFVDGVYNTNIRPTGTGTLAWFSINVGAGTHSVTLVSGQTSRPSATILGSWVVAVAGINLSVSKLTTGRRLIWYADSLISACSTQQGNNDLVAKFRAVYPGRVSCEAYGFRAAFDDTTDTALTNRITRHAADSSVIDLVCMIGTNDYGLNKQTAANFQTQIGTRFASINTALGSKLRMIWAVTPPTRGTESANGLGSTCGNYRTSITNAASGKAYVTVIDGTSFGLNTSTDYIETPASSALHFNDTGAGKVFTGIRTPMGV